MKQKKSRDRHIPLLVISLTSIPFMMLGLFVFHEFVGIPSSWSMPLGAFVWSLIAALVITVSVLTVRSITKEAGGGIRCAVLPTAMQLLAFVSMGAAAALISGNLFEISSGSYLALGLVGLMPALVVFNCWMYRRERQIGRLSTARAFLTATEYMSLGVLFIAWSYLSQAVSWTIAVDVLLVIGAAAVLFGDIWRVGEDASGLGLFLRKLIKSPQRG